VDGVITADNWEVVRRPKILDCEHHARLKDDDVNASYLRPSIFNTLATEEKSEGIEEDGILQNL
jgi:hypothetical protein